MASTTTTALPATTITSTASPTTAATTTTTPTTVPPSLAALGTETITVGGRSWLVAVADTEDERIQGLRRVADLGALDGMIFVYDTEVNRSFTMRTVPIPLDIGFFDADGVLFDIVSMEPCGDNSDCPLYTASAAFRYAIETEAGGWAETSVGAALVREN